MPVKKKPVAVKRRKRRATVAKPATRKKTTKRRKKTAAAARTTTKRRRKTKAGTKKAVAKRPRRKTTAKRRKTKIGVKHKRKMTMRGKPKSKGTVKKKPNKRSASKRTSNSSHAQVNREPRAVKKINSKRSTTTTAVRKSVNKKRKQAQSDSQVHPVVKQQPLLEVKMAESKKLKKRTKTPLPETRQESVSTRTESDLNMAPYKERPGEDYMSSHQQAHFRCLLLQRKRMLLEDMGRTVHHLQDEGVSLPDISDRATQEEEFNLELRARDRERKLIKKIEEALQQLDEGRYGFCHSCGVEIGVRRLEARPTANLCIDCKTLDEIREKQMGG